MLRRSTALPTRWTPRTIVFPLWSWQLSIANLSRCGEEKECRSEPAETVFQAHVAERHWISDRITVPGCHVSSVCFGCRIGAAVPHGMGICAERHHHERM